MNQVVSIQICRGIAAWLVVFHHLAISYQYSDSNGVAWFFLEKGAFGVDLFFVISGFIMFTTLSSKKYSAGKFMYHRIMRVVPAYWFYTVVLLGLSEFLSEEFSFTKWTSSSLVLSALFFPHFNPSGLGIFPFLTVGWTLNFEMFFYFSLAFCIFLAHKLKFVLCSVIMFGLPLVNFSNVPGIGLYSPIIGDKIIYEFVVGIWIGYLFAKYQAINFKYSAFFGLGFVLLGLVLLYFSNTRKVWIFSAAFIISSVLVFEDFFKNKIFSFFRVLGDISYSTYLIHVLVINAARRIWPATNSMVEVAVLVCLVSLIIIAFSYLSYRTIERLPVQFVEKLRFRLVKNY